MSSRPIPEHPDYPRIAWTFEYWCKQYDALATDRAQLETALREMVDRWEPDGLGADRRMWENARAALGFPIDRGAE